MCCNERGSAGSRMGFVRQRRGSQLVTKAEQGGMAGDLSVARFAPDQQRVQ